MNRTALASAVILSAALITAGCGAGTSAHSADPAPHGTQSYASMLDLDGAVSGGHTQCTGLAMQPTTVAKTQATCDLGGGQQLVLQLWRDSESRDAGVATLTAIRTTPGLGYCVVSGRGDEGLWSVDASADPAVCADVAARLGGRVHKTAATAH